MLHLKLANLEDVKAEHEALSKIPVEENGYLNDWANVSFEEFKKNGIRKIIANAEGKELPEGYVPCSIYFLWDDAKIVGVFHFRHYLCDSLKKRGGHLGYTILPEFRGQHYATDGLRIFIETVKNMVLEDELWLDAYRTNIASQKVMLNNGAYVVKEDDQLVYMRIKLDKD